MAENEVFITAVITPAEGKADRVCSQIPHHKPADTHYESGEEIPRLTSSQVEELLRAVVDDVKKNEPATMQYQLHKKLDGQGDTQFVVIERYESAKAVEKHKEGEA